MVVCISVSSELRRILRQEWVRGWDGWDEVVVRCDNASSVEEKHNITEECLIRLARISMDNVHERFMSDIDMQRQLPCGNLHIGKSEQFGRNNACLADSLLQLLMQERVIDTPVFDNAAAEKKWRGNACLAVRTH